MSIFIFNFCKTIESRTYFAYFHPFSYKLKVPTNSHRVWAGCGFKSIHWNWCLCKVQPFNQFSQFELCTTSPATKIALSVSIAELYAVIDFDFFVRLLSWNRPLPIYRPACRTGLNVSDFQTSKCKATFSSEKKVCVSKNCIRFV